VLGQNRCRCKEVKLTKKHEMVMKIDKEMLNLTQMLNKQGYIDDPSIVIKGLDIERLALT